MKKDIIVDIKMRRGERPRCRKHGGMLRNILDTKTSIYIYHCLSCDKEQSKTEMYFLGMGNQDTSKVMQRNEMHCSHYKGEGYGYDLGKKDSISLCKYCHLTLAENVFGQAALEIFLSGEPKGGYTKKKKVKR